MFRYSLRTLFIGITVVAVLMAVGLRWLQTSEELTIEFYFPIELPNELELIEPEKKEAAEITRRRLETRKWMADHRFQLQGDQSLENTDRFDGSIVNFGHVQVIAHYNSVLYSCEATFEWRRWVWERREITKSPGQSNVLNSFMQKVSQVVARDYYLEDSVPPLPKPRTRIRKADSP